MLSPQGSPEAHAPLRARAASAFAGVTLATLGLAAIVAPAVGARGAFPIKAAGVLSILWYLTAPSLPRHGRPTFGPANAVTLGRAMLLGFVAGFVGDPIAPDFAWPLLVAGGAGFALDSVDGRVARATGTSSPYGARLDMELDAITMVVLSALVWQLGAPAWVLVAGALRYAFLLAGRALPWLDRPLFPTERRRLLCGVAVTLLLVAIAPLPDPSRWLCAAGAVAALVGSFGADTVWLVANRRAPL